MSNWLEKKKKFRNGYKKVILRGKKFNLFIFIKLLVIVVVILK